MYKLSDFSVNKIFLSGLLLLPFLLHDMKDITAFESPAE